MVHKGLRANEALELQKKFGENILPGKEKYNWFTILLEQIKSPLIYILFFAGAVSFYFKEYNDIILIFAVIFLDVIMGFYQEYSAQKTLQALKKIIKAKAIVIRDGKRKEIEVKDIVPRDIVVLGSGDRIPADGKLLEGFNILVNEAILTGEEEAVQKNTQKEKNLLFMGTTVVSGTGLMVIEKIGAATEIGKIGQSLREIKKEKTPLQIKLEKFSRNLAFIIAWVCLFVFLVEVIFYRQDIWEMLRIAVILAVAAVPEGLPIAVTIIMALGMKRILKKNGLVKRLLSIETLGSTSVICTDKTGTITEGIMRVVRTDFIDEKQAFLALALANEQRTNMEISLWDYIKKENGGNPQKIFDSCPRLYSEPFSSDKKYSLTVNGVEGKETAFILGAPEIVTSFCDLPAAQKKNILKQIENWAGEGLRILGVATKGKGDLKEKKKFLWLGLIGIEDPIRQGVPEAIKRAQEAGIKIKIVTGDYRKTAEKVAGNLGFKITPANVMEGAELENISDEELKEKIDNIILFTRVSPSQKLKIVKALQEKGEVVSMTGDGVNDAPALKKADIGVVVQDASDVAKETADLVLLDNNFKTIVDAVEEGRLVFFNMKKVISYALSNSFSEIILIFGAMLLKFPVPLAIIQILWIHLICDGPPDILLSFEPKEKHLMKEVPKNIRREQILDRSTKVLIASISSIAGILALFFFWYFNEKVGDIALARTMAFATLAVVDLVYIFSFKSATRPLFKTENFFKNKFLFWGVAYGFILVFAAIYIPGLNKLLETVPLKASYWLFPLSAAIITTLLVELVKAVRRNRKSVGF
ncbi:MAG: HAD-IC family P-type ATPase [Patescibacteria group bacterium]